jgi:hypothetical protein
MLPEGMEVSFETSILRPTSSPSSVGRMSTIPSSPAPVSIAPLLVTSFAAYSCSTYLRPFRRWRTLKLQISPLNQIHCQCLCPGATPCRRVLTPWNHHLLNLRLISMPTNHRSSFHRPVANATQVKTIDHSLFAKNLTHLLHMYF